MNALSADKKVHVISALVEGNSIRSTERMTGVHRDTIMRLALSFGEDCSRLLDRLIRKVRASRVEVDEIWTFVFKKQARITSEDNEAEMGDQYVFVAIDSNTNYLTFGRQAGCGLSIPLDRRFEGQAGSSSAANHGRLSALSDGG